MGFFAFVLFAAAVILAIVALSRSAGAERRWEQSRQQLSRRIYDLESRLLKMERQQAAPIREATPVPAAMTAAPKAATSLPPAAGPAPRAEAPAMAHDGDAKIGAEALFAGRWLNYIGLLALAVAAAFFLKYAFDNGWIGPAGRVGIGLAIGGALYPLSHRVLRRGLAVFSEGLVGLGAAILFLSVWAGWHYYLLFPQPTAFAMMVGVTVATAIIAAGRRSQRIAVLAAVGGALTPALVSTGPNAELALFAYLTALAAGFLALAWKYDWRGLAPLLFATAELYFWGWFFAFYRQDEMATTLAFATVFFVLFAARSVLRRSRDLEREEIALMLANAGLYFVALVSMLWVRDRWGLTLAVLALAAAHWRAMRALGAEQQAKARMLHACLALAWATLAVPIRLTGKWIAIAWAIEGVGLIAAGTERSRRALASLGLGLLALVGLELCLVPFHAGPAFLWNERFLTLAFCSACFATAALIGTRADLRIGLEQRQLFPGLYVAANICLLTALSLEVWRLFSRPGMGAESGRPQLALTVLWLAYATALLAGGALAKAALARWQGLGLLGIAVIKAFLFDLSFLGRGYRIVSFLLLGVVLVAVSYFYQRRQATRR